MSSHLPHVLQLLRKSLAAVIMRNFAAIWVGMGYERLSETTGNISPRGVYDNSTRSNPLVTLRATETPLTNLV